MGYVFDFEFVGSEGAGAGGDEDGAGDDGLAVGIVKMKELFVGIELKIFDTEAHFYGLGAMHGGLFEHHVCEFSGDDFGEAGHVVDIFFGVEGCELATGLGEAV